jgi:hypothetical protein
MRWASFWPSHAIEEMELEKTAAKLRCPKSSPLAALRFPKLALVWIDRGGHTGRNWLLDMVFVLCSVAQPWFYLALCTPGPLSDA